jgi:hypothetical protein
MFSQQNQPQTGRNCRSRSAKPAGQFAVERRISLSGHLGRAGVNATQFPPPPLLAAIDRASIPIAGSRETNTGMGVAFARPRPTAGGR